MLQLPLVLGVGMGTDFLPELGELAKKFSRPCIRRGGDQVAMKDVDGTIKFMEVKLIHKKNVLELRHVLFLMRWPI